MAEQRPAEGAPGAVRTGDVERLAARRAGRGSVEDNFGKSVGEVRGGDEER